MKFPKWAIAVAVIVLLAIWGISKYNGLVTIDQNVKNKWSQVENQYQRRSDLIPNIIRKTKRAAHRKRSVHPHTLLRRNEALHFRGIYQGRSATIRTPFLHQSNRVGSSSLT